MASVGLYDHAARFRAHETELAAAFSRVMNSGRPDWGKEGPAFEQAWSDWIGVGHTVGTNSGMASLRLALLALDLGPGDEVITPVNSDIASTAAIDQVGATPVWVDVLPDTLNMDPAAVVQAITPRTRAIMAVHLYGHLAPMAELEQIAQQHNLLLIEDACLAPGAVAPDTQGQPRAAGHWGQIACFSFAPTKHLGAFGSAGCCTTSSAQLAERMQLLVGYGQTRERVAAGLPGLDLLEAGINDRLDELQAAFLRTLLPQLSGWIAQRQAMAQRYQQGITHPGLFHPPTLPGYSHVYRNYVVQVENRDRVDLLLRERGIATHRPYAPALHQQPAYANRPQAQHTFPVAEHTAGRLLSLPIWPQMTPDQQNFVIDRVNEVLETP